MFDSILIANRSEIAVRIARTCRDLGVSTVAVFSDPDAQSRHVAACDRAIALVGVAPVDTYLNIDALVAAAREAQVEAVHPGYGFLSENAAFAEAVEEAGLAWVGPPPAALRNLGDKITARRIAEKAGVPVVPGITDAVSDQSAVAEFGDQHGFPVAIKAAGGGGGRGLKIARAPEDVPDALASARREAEAYFGSADVFVERYLENPKHLEVQILGSADGTVLWLGVRDCSLQRRHQKLVEETPPVFKGRLDDLGEAAVKLASAAGYVNAGTCEFLAEPDGSFYFLECNARLQVEHTVTEEVTGIDLVACQLRIAAGDELGFGQSDIAPRGHAIECRINAEDPARGFAPTPGLITSYREPAGYGVRVDSGYGSGDVVPQAYDSLIAKVIARGVDREEARRRMLRALEEFDVGGISTTIPAHVALLENEDFIAGTHSTTTVESGALSVLEVARESGPDNVLLIGGRGFRLWNPAMAASASAAAHDDSSASGDVVAPMQGTVLKILVTEGEEVSAGQAVAIIEAMKMETSIAAPRAGKISSLHAIPGTTVASGEVLAVLE